MFFRAYLGWSLKHVAQNYFFIFLSQNCVPKCFVWIGLSVMMALSAAFTVSRTIEFDFIDVLAAMTDVPSFLFIFRVERVSARPESISFFSAWNFMDKKDYLFFSFPGENRNRHLQQKIPRIKGYELFRPKSLSSVIWWKEPSTSFFLSFLQIFKIKFFKVSKKTWNSE